MFPALGGTNCLGDRAGKAAVVERSFARVDVTEEFPFLVTKLSPYFDR